MPNGAAGFAYGDLRAYAGQRHSPLRTAEAALTTTIASTVGDRDEALRISGSNRLARNPVARLLADAITGYAADGSGLARGPTSASKQKSCAISRAFSETAGRRRSPAARQPLRQPALASPCVLASDGLSGLYRVRWPSVWQLRYGHWDACHPRRPAGPRRP